MGLCELRYDIVLFSHFSKVSDVIPSDYEKVSACCLLVLPLDFTIITYFTGLAFFKGGRVTMVFC